MSHKSRKIAGVVASAAAGIGLLGGGTYAAFTDSATATDNVSVGTFGIAVSIPSTLPPGVTETLNGNNVTCGLTTAILSSAAGSAPCTFTVKNAAGKTIPANVTVTSDLGSPAFSAQVNGAANEFSDIFPDSGQSGAKTLVPSGGLTYNGGIKWGALDSHALGQSQSVTYTISASDS